MGGAKEGCEAMQHAACIESYINKPMRRIGSHGEPDFTKIQIDKRHRNPQGRIPGNP